MRYSVLLLAVLFLALPVRAPWLSDVLAQGPSTRAPVMAGIDDKAKRLSAEVIVSQPPPPLYTAQQVVNVRLSPGQLSGRVLSVTDHRPLARAWVHLDDQIVQTDAEGWFAFKLEKPTAGAHLFVRAAGYTRGRWVLGDPQQVSPPAWDAIHPLPLEAATAQMRTDACTPSPCLEIMVAPFPVRALYIPLALLSRPDLIVQLLDMAEQSAVLNSVVIDVKGDTGLLAWDSTVPTAVDVKAYHHGKKWLSLDEFIQMCRQRKLYIVARMVIFKDAKLAEGKPEWAIRRADGTIWVDRKGTPWVNPFLNEVWDYNVALAREAATLGVDEIQLDYVRFPSDGALGEISYGQESKLETRTAAIRQFVERFATAVRPLGVFVAADVFGLTIWVVPESDMLIGQRVMDIGPLVDYLSPMLYPFTFTRGNLGLDAPRAYPYEVVQRSTQQAAARLPPGVRVRPWLQAYSYSLAEMLIQRRAAVDSTKAGWMFWNAAGKYNPDLFGPLPDLDTLRAIIAQQHAAQAAPTPAPSEAPLGG